jgi:hypothetical protein
MPATPCITTKDKNGVYKGHLALIRALAKLGKEATAAAEAAGRDKPTKRIWIFDLEKALKAEGYSFGPHFKEGGEDNYLRRVKNARGKARKTLLLNLMMQGDSEEEANSRIEAIAGLNWNIDSPPDMGVDVMAFIADL